LTRRAQEERIHIFDRLAWATRFEEYLALKYKGVKRFGLEGCESLIPGMKAFIDLSSELGIEHVVRSRVGVAVWLLCVLSVACALCCVYVCCWSVD
jgi:2-oxoglutarate dehydrogenase complex dehydrogenase (E1) component-like enzyme